MYTANPKIEGQKIFPTLRLALRRLPDDKDVDDVDGLAAVAAGGVS